MALPLLDALDCTSHNLSTDKEERVLEILGSLKCQFILTTTLKAEEHNKYVVMQGVNAIDYTNHQSNKILGTTDFAEFQKLLKSMGICIGN